MADITIAQLTEGTVEGSGVFDVLMKAVNAQLLSQYEKSRITGTDYANVYLGSMQSAMAQAVQFLLGEQTADKQGDLLAQKIITEEAQTTDINAGTVGKQQGLLQAQTDGFERDAEQKALKIMMDSWTIRRTTDNATVPPTKAEDTDIDKFIEKIASGINITL